MLKRIKNWFNSFRSFENRYSVSDEKLNDLKNHFQNNNETKTAPSQVYQQYSDEWFVECLGVEEIFQGLFNDDKSFVISMSEFRELFKLIYEKNITKINKYRKNLARFYNVKVNVLNDNIFNNKFNEMIDNDKKYLEYSENIPIVNQDEVNSLI